MSHKLVIAAAVIIATSFAGHGFAADDTKVKSATRQVEEGARTIGDGKVGPGVEETAKGVGNTVVEGAKYTGDKLKRFTFDAPSQFLLCPREGHYCVGVRQSGVGAPLSS